MVTEGHVLFESCEHQRYSSVFFMYVLEEFKRYKE